MWGSERGVLPRHPGSELLPVKNAQCGVQGTASDATCLEGVDIEIRPSKGSQNVHIAKLLE